jgi:hypothetical protein
MASFGYQYFCGANVVIEIEGFPLLEAAGMQYSISESKRPIYGYSSRHFDAVARGQVVVQGALIINYVHQDYLFRAIEQGISTSGLTPNVDFGTIAAKEHEDQLANIQESSRLGSELLLNYKDNVSLSEAFKNKHWSIVETEDPGNSFNSLLPNPHDSFGGHDIRVTFGTRNESTGMLGDTGLILTDVYFTGRGVPIQIDENVIVEEYPFFARNIYSLRQPYIVVEEASPVGGTLDNQFTLKPIRI